MNFVKKTLRLEGGGFFGLFFNCVVKAKGKIINPLVLFVCHYENDSSDFFSFFFFLFLPCYMDRSAMAKVQSAHSCP